MLVRLENLSAYPVLLLLSSGETVRLSPGETSPDLPDVEVKASPKVDKLAARGVLAVHEQPKRSSAEKATRPAAARSEPKHDVDDARKPAKEAAKTS